jgi:predicted Rdx family selenoprotein
VCVSVHHLFSLVHILFLFFSLGTLLRDCYVHELFHFQSTFSCDCYLLPIDEEWNERLQILRDARNLAKVADFFLNPHKSVVTWDPCACGRNYFSRPSAEEYEDESDAEQRELILQEMKQLKQLAVDYMHPEKPVVTSDAFGCARNYFDRPSAEPTCSPEEAEEQARILADAKQLKQLAVDYMHPEKPVKTTHPCACGRNYFTRPSAVEYEDEEAAQDRELVLEDMKHLKQLAVDYLHPEKPVVTSDPFACGRNFFSRPSAEEYEAKDEEKELIMEEMKQLKKLAVDYLHPEKPVVTLDPCATGRNYFSRPSAEEYEDEDAMDEREEILEDMKQLKQFAQDYLQPERPVEVDPLASCRNYFYRASAEGLDHEYTKESELIFQEMKQLKQLAVDYLHPEKPVKTTDAFACGRNYFTRPTALEFEGEEAAQERELVLADMKHLKRLAVDYLHPEMPVGTSDPFACGRNYFARPSADEYEDEDHMDDRDEILEDMKQLKQLAVDYLHPERPVEIDPLASSHCYFNRPSAPEQESRDEASERNQVLADARALKQLAVDYLHPERPVVTSDPFACGRNYFSRPSAEESIVDMEEREMILQEMKQLKQLAVDYMHPELPVVTRDLFACGRNFFSRPSAEEYEAKDEEKGLILEEMKQLKKLAVDYLHPEKPVVTLDPCATGRNYFARASATEQVSHEVSEEQARIFQDMAQLKKLSTDYMHPERPIESTGGARNYFDRASASGHADHIHSRGYAIDHSANYPYAYHDHVLDLVHHEHGDDDSHQSEHFEMDEDALQTFRDNLHSIEFFNGQHPKEGVVGKDEEEGGHLSRSPSSVMLFDLATM